MQNEDRKAELLKIICKAGDADKVKAERLIDEVVFLEKSLAELRALPFIKINPKDPTKQKATPAAKQYKELLQQYNNTMKLLLKISGDLNGETEEDSPLRIWTRAQMEKKV